MRCLLRNRHGSSIYRTGTTWRAVLQRQLLSATTLYLITYALICALAVARHPLWCTLLVRGARFFRRAAGRLRRVLPKNWDLPLPLLCAHQLFDVIVQHELLQNVIQSITRNGIALLLTASLGVITLYVFSVAGFLLFPQHFGEDRCTSVFACTVTTAYLGSVGPQPRWSAAAEGAASRRGCAWIMSGRWGVTCSLRSGGGIGDVLEAVAMHEPGHLARFLYDTAFYYLMIVLLMNLLFGIIIDTFADLREEKSSTCIWPYPHWSLGCIF